MPGHSGAGVFRSLRFRMAVSHAFVLAVIVGTLGGAGYLLLARSLDRGVTRELATAAREQAERISEHGVLLPPPDSDIPSRAAVQLALYASDGTLVGEPSEVPSWLTPRPSEVTDVEVAGEPVRIVTVPVTVGGGAVDSVVAARSLAPEETLLHRVRLLLLAGGGLALAASLGAGWMLAGRAVRPVRRAYDAQAGFAADASHELRTPLTFIRSGVEVLAEREPELGREVLSEIDYLTRLTQRMLLLARAESDRGDRGGVDLEIERIDVAELCRSAARRGEGALGLEHERVADAPEGASALGDRVAAEAALDAVLENVAVHGGGAATLRWRRRDGELVISVEDHGPGLSDGLAERAFERFARGDPSRTRETGGAGLGLSLAKTLVEAQGGRMWLEPTPGGGLTVAFALRSA